MSELAKNLNISGVDLLSTVAQSTRNPYRGYSAGEAAEQQPPI